MCRQWRWSRLLWDREVNRKAQVASDINLNFIKCNEKFPFKSSCRFLPLTYCSVVTSHRFGSTLPQALACAISLTNIDYSSMRSLAFARVQFQNNLFFNIIFKFRLQQHLRGEYMSSEFNEQKYWNVLIHFLLSYVVHWIEDNYFKVKKYTM